MSAAEGGASLAPDPAPAASFFRDHQQCLIDAGRLGPLADLACGRGRNALAAAELGIPTLALDRSAGFLRELGASAARRKLEIQCLRSDLETPHGIPLRAESCGSVLVFRFLFRPLCPHIEALLRPGGWLLYETFTSAQAQLPSGPSNPAFLLLNGELPELFPGLEIHSFEEFSSTGERPEAVARLLARKPE